MGSGHRPTLDPRWTHEHVPTGAIRECSQLDCPATWPVTCHNHTRKLCDTCSQGLRRKRDRKRKQASRLKRADMRQRADMLVLKHELGKEDFGDDSDDDDWPFTYE